MTNREPEEETVEITTRLPRSLCQEIERLVPVDQREAFYRVAVERELLLRENSD